MQNFIGKEIDRYRITERLGMGGMAVVYRAYDTRLDRDVALKLIRTEAIPQEQHERLLRRFEREAKSQARFKHNHIVKVFDYGEVDGVPYLVMDFVPGGTLKTRTGQPVAYSQAVCWLIPIADALNYAHQRGVIHRDIKPSNILFDEDDQPVLTDFGIAKLLETEEATLTGTGMGVGTPEYMAPEQWQGKASPATDQYALGVVLYELLTGQKPYTADTPPMVAILQATEPLRAPSQLVKGIPAAVEKVLYKALAKNPADRYENMAGFRSALEGLLDLNLTSTSEQTEAITTPQLGRELHFEPAGEFERGMEQFKERLRESRASAEKPAPSHYRSAPEPDSESETVDIVEGINTGAVTTHEPWAEGEHFTQKKSKKRGWWIVGGLIGAAVIVGVVFGMLTLGRDRSLPDTPSEGEIAEQVKGTTVAALVGLPTKVITAAEPEPAATSIPVGSTIFCKGNGIFHESICNPNWQLDGHDSSRTSWNPLEQGLTPPLAVDWQTKIEDYTADGISLSNRFIFLSGMDATGDYKNSVRALNKVGDPMWSFVLEGSGGAMDHPPAIAGNSAYFGGQGDDVLYALDQNTGELKWTKPGFGSLYASPVNIYDEIIFGFGSGQLMALFDNGDQSWLANVDGWGGRTAIWEDTIVALSWNTKPTAYNKNSGEVIWERADLQIYFSDVIAIDELVYLGSGGHIFALNVENGNTVWETSLSEVTSIDDYRLAYANGVLLAAGGQRATDEDPTPRQVLMAMDGHTGDIIWQTPSAAIWDEVVVANGYVYAFCMEEHLTSGKVLALDLSTGEEVWAWTPEENIWFARFVVADGRLYLVYSPLDSFETYLVAFKNE